MSKRGIQTLIVVILLALVCGCRSDHTGPQARAGFLDLTGWDYASEGLAKVEGEWQVIHGAWVPPDQIEPQKGPFEFFPALWKGASAKGAATCALVVEAGQLERRGALLIETPLSVVRVWVNGKPVGESGTPGLNAKEEEPRRHSVFACFPHGGGPVEIVLHFSNFANATGGLNASIWMGPEDQVTLMRERSGILAAGFGGAFFLLALFHLAFYVLRRNHRVNLYFGLYCLMWCLSTLFGNVGGCLMDSLFPGLPWRLTIDAALISVGISIPLLVMFYHQLYPYRFSRWVDGSYLLIGLLYVGWLSLTPPQAFGPVPKAYILVSLSIVPYLGWRFLRDIRAGRPGIRLLIPGYLVLVFSGAAELFFDFHLVGGRMLSLISAFLFIAPYSFLIASRISRTYARVDALSNELAKRRATEEMLKQTQGRLAAMLNRLSMPLVAINESFEICFANHAFEALSGEKAENLLGRFWLDLLGSGHQEAMRTRMDRWFDAGDGQGSDAGELGFQATKDDNTLYRAHVLPMAFDDERLALVVLADAGGLVEASTWVGDLNCRQERFRLVMDVLEEMAKGTGNASAPVCSPGELESLEEMAQRVRIRMTGDDHGALRELAVEVMALSLDLWTGATGMSKAELARQSGLWKVYTDKDGWDRTQTLDRYLKLKTFPQKPRLTQVIQTAEFVLASCAGCEATDGRISELTDKLSRLKSGNRAGCAA